MTKLGLMGLRLGVQLPGQAREVWFAGECGNCRVQLRKLVARTDLHYGYGFFVLPWDTRSPIAPILTACNVAVPDSLSGGYILIGYANKDVNLRPNQALIVQIEPIEGEREESALAWIAANAVESDALPPDLAEQHDHYLYGRPKKR
jgi:hypothetical protein